MWMVRYCLPSRTSARSARLRADSKRNWQLTRKYCIDVRYAILLVVLEDNMTIVTASKAFLTMFGITEAGDRRRRVSNWANITGTCLRYVI